jgi:PAS domain S-box-containing protein
MPLANKRAIFDAIDELPLPYIEMDARGIILRVNTATTALIPPELGDLVGKPAWSFLTADEKEMSFAAYAALMHSGEQPPAVLRSLYDRTGQFRTYELHRSFKLDADGKPCGVRMLCRDVTDSVRSLDEARQERARLADVFACIADPLIVTDALGFIAMMNPAAEALLRRDLLDLAGKSFEEALPLASPSRSRKTLRSFVQALEQPQKLRVAVLDGEGRRLKLEINTSPLVEKLSGGTSGVVIILRKSRD